MTNEEKSKEIAENNKCTYYVISRYLGGDTEEYYSQDECYQSAMEMAKWKDEKFYKVLACIKISLEKQGISVADNFIEDVLKQWEE